MTIEKYFDTVNYDKQISVLGERINDAPTLHLIRSFFESRRDRRGIDQSNDGGCAARRAAVTSAEQCVS